MDPITIVIAIVAALVGGGAVMLFKSECIVTLGQKIKIWCKCFRKSR